ncbi:ABC transporter substrate-binding protein [Chloroflexota bacterium]
MNKCAKTIGLTGIIVAMVLGLLVTSCGTAEDKTTDKEVIRVGLNAGFTGPGAISTALLSECFIEYMRYTNETGGIDGVPIEVIWYDNGGLMNRGLINHKKYVEAGVVMEACAGGTTYLPPIKTKFESEAIPITAIVELSPELITRPKQWIFVNGAGVGPHSASLIKWIVDNWEGQNPPRIGAITWEHMMGYATVDFMDDMADDLGVEWLGYEVIPAVGVIDTTVELLRIAAKDPDWIICNSIQAGQITMVENAEMLGLWDRGIKFANTQGTLDEGIIAIAGDSCNDWYMERINPPIHDIEDAPWMETVMDYRDIARDEITMTYICGWIQNSVTVEAIRLAVEEVGIENLDGRAVRDTFCRVTDFETDCGIPPVTMTNDQFWWAHDVKMYQIQDGRMVSISGSLGPYYLLPLVEQ